MAEKNTAQQLLDSGLVSRLIFDKLENKQVKDALKIYAKVEKELRQKLAKLDPTEPIREATKRKRLMEYLKQVRQIILGANRTLKNQIQLGLIDLAETSMIDMAQALEIAVPFTWSSKVLSDKQLRAIVTEQPFQGATLREWSSNQSQATLNKLQRDLQIGLVQGESIGQLSRRVKGTMKTAGNQATAVIRTAVNHVSNKARTMVIDENSEITNGRIWWATLDNRTSGICRANHGRKFKHGEGENLLPAHFQCRSVWIADIKGFDEITKSRTAPFRVRVPDENWKSSDIRRWLKQQGEKVPAGKLDADGNVMRYKSGSKKGQVIPVPKKELLLRSEKIVGPWRNQLRGRINQNASYHDWLSTQPDFVIREVYGKRRLDLFKAGKAKLSEFDSRGQGLLTGDQLKSKFGGRNVLKSPNALKEVLD